MGDVRVGACSWTDRQLVTSGWYPRGRRDAEGRLRHYASRLPVVEVDSGYYALPSRRNSELWVERTPDGFRFDVKAFSLLTGHPTRPEALPADLRDAERGPALLDEVWKRFAYAVEPLRAAGRLGAVLFQFPPWFAPGAGAEETLAECAGRTAGWPLAVEFRHPGWWAADRADATAALLTRLGASAVGVDMAQDLPGSLPPVLPVTARSLAVVRFHGRSPQWGRGSKEDRFRYAYDVSELAAWVPRLRRAAGQADELHVLFNNCCADAAVRAAETMRDLLSEPVPSR
ncbi:MULTISPECIES: DUF72 domain-containing protein [Streptomyces]|jgi:uncharacterized protein YecE (DUF72 family)|uniref:Uncharacterized protein YecE (DUF72 family) n=2 Tax=Streptomyces TaxID=1883 RepID=A0ABT9LNM2_STRGD|nr:MULTISPECIES: DUF72 domain-containing protein [Streptomyces]MDP9685128.1 uncharacterized protein YecE (DUF72 family) [Streptomyces griseoviridis]GGS94913.1 hypothetical protein GCM10010240_30290 [Streptomyces griseoviridis]GGU32644.1 hypothetical protein GCM10010259_24080 [Streptomyces daghestanicus]GHI32027.1 hypothetical protein Sdagh_37570 [Streptomyces daghestanicus]